MEVSGVICEYNPLHLGHAHQLSEMKKSGAVIALMSGSFTQRGTPAVLSKYERAAVAISAGADLVLELPFPFSSARADTFGRAGVEILNALGCVTSLCFGSETGELHALTETEVRLSSPAFEEALSALLQKEKTLSHHDAMAKAYAALYGESTSISGSNDMLALAYLKALRETGASIRPTAIRRIGEDYNGGGEGFASATTVRKWLSEGAFDKIKSAVPPASAEALLRAAETGTLYEEGRLYPLFAFLVRRNAETITSLPDIPRELLSRMKKAALSAKSTEEILSLAAARQYSPSRIRRGMLYALMNVTEEHLCHPAYTAVLAANETGRRILKSIRKTAAIPLVTKPADAGLFGEDAARAFALSAKADSIHALLCQSPAAGDAMMKEHPRMI